MKIWAPLLAMFFIVAWPGFSQNAMSISDVIEMVHAGLPDDVVIAKLHKTNQPFDLTAQQMVELKKQGISDNIIKVMIDPTAQVASQPAPAPFIGIATPKASGATPTTGTSEAAIAANINNPDAPHDSGIYVYTSDRNNQKVMIGLERAAYQGTKGNFLGHAITPFVKAKMRAIIPGPRASIRVSDPRPEFYFYFEDKSAALGKSGFGAQTVSNPNQFALIKLEAKKDNRETVTGSIGFASMDFGTDPKAMIAFKADKIRPGVYRVTPTANMEPGEYAFIGAGTGAMGMAGTSAAMDIFDFAVTPNN